MKPEEALRELEWHRQECAADHGHEPHERRAEALRIVLHERRAEALRIVLAMAKAAQGMADALEEAADLLDDVRDGSYAPDAFSSQPARLALAEFRKASGGDAP